MEVQRVPADEVEDAGSYVSDFFSMVRPTGPGGSRFSMVRPTGLRGRGRFFSMVRSTGLRGRGRFFSMVRPTGPGGVSDFFFQWSAQRAREEFRIFFFNGPPNGPGRGFGFFFSMVRPTGPGGVSDFFFSMVRPTGPGGVSDFFFQWSAQRAREEFRIFFFNGPPNGPGRGFVCQWSAQRVCGVGVGLFSMVRPTRLRGRGRFFSMVRPTGPGGVSDFFFTMVRPTGPGGVSFFNGPPNGPGRGFVFQWFAQRVW